MPSTHYTENGRGKNFNLNEERKVVKNLRQINHVLRNV